MKRSKTSNCKVPQQEMFRACWKCCRHCHSGFTYCLQYTTSTKVKLGKIIDWFLKPGSTGSTVVVAAWYNRTRWQEWSWDTLCAWEMWNECGKMNPKEDLSPMKIAIWLTDTTALKNTSQKKATCKTRQQSQPVQQRSFCYLPSCTNTALIFLCQLRAFEHFTFVFLVALQNFRLQVCTDRISIPPPAGKTSTEWCEEFSATYYHFSSNTHTNFMPESCSPNRETGGSSNHKSGSNDQQCLSIEKSRVLSKRRNMIFLSWCRRLLYKTSSLRSQEEKKSPSPRVSMIFSIHTGNLWQNSRILAGPGFY